jgi:hypothetical protein
MTALSEWIAPAAQQVHNETVEERGQFERNTLPTVHCRSAPEEKIGLFRSFFRGRKEAYRRDRRKDALLQENGHFVLRFLAAGASKRLDEVLDAILRALVRRRGGGQPHSGCVPGQPGRRSG